MSRTIYSKHIKPRYYNRKANNLCVYCGKEKENNNLICCNSCSESKKQKERNTYRYLKALGLCTRCRRVNDTDKVLCSFCSEKKNKARKDIRDGKR